MLKILITSCAVAVVALSAYAQTITPAETDHSKMDHSKHQMQSGAQQKTGKVKDTRPLVKYPDDLRIHTLTNMRDHLFTMGEIQQALSTLDFDKAAQLAENKLGMSSLKLHGAHDVAPYMPKGMQDMGTLMHRTASQFAATAQEASVTGDLKGTLAALSRLNQTCVACHAGYRLQ